MKFNLRHRTSYLHKWETEDDAPEELRCLQVTRNNILHVRTPQNRCISEAKQNIDNDFDYDLYNGRVPQDQEANGVRGEPVYTADADFDFATKTGEFQLTPSSPGAGASQPIPNFSNGYTGSAPDIGAHQRGNPPMRFGVAATQP